MRSVFILLLCFSIRSLFAQDGQSVFIYNKDWSPAKNIRQAVYLMHQVKENDTVYICRYYRKEGPMVKWETYRDSALEIPNGRFAWYNENGTLDSLGTVTNGKKDKNWYYNYDDKGHARLEEYFENCRFKSRTNYVTRTRLLADGTIEPLDKPKQIDTASAKTITVVQHAAAFPGGIPAWTSHLSNNLHTPNRLIGLSGPNTKATVGVEFIVNKEGHIGDVFIWRSYEWSADLEAIRVIKTAPDWTPAEQNGKLVIYRHRQTITYQIGN